MTDKFWPKILYVIMMDIWSRFCDLILVNEPFK